MIDVRTFPSTRAVELGEDSGHFPVVATITGSDVVIVYRAGAGHIGLAGRLECVRTEDHGQTWSSPSVVADSDRDDRNPSIGVTHSGAIVVGYYVCGYDDREGKSDHRVRELDTFFTRSHDGGLTWERPYRLNYEPLNRCSPYGQMLTLEDGTLLMPTYGTREGEELGGSFLLHSKDEGKTWGQPTLVAEGKGEPAFLILPSGEWLASLRGNFSSKRSGRFEQALYLARAQGLTGPWSQPEFFGDPPRYPACLTLLGNGDVLMVYGYRAEPYGARGVISHDEGRTWSLAPSSSPGEEIIFGDGEEIILGDKAATWDCGYPSTVRLSDGTLVTAFYSVGPHGDPYSCEGARCNVIFYSEEELLYAIGHR